MMFFKEALGEIVCVQRSIQGTQSTIKKVFFVNFLLIFIYLASSIFFCIIFSQIVVVISDRLFSSSKKCFFNVFGFLRGIFSFYLPPNLNTLIHTPIGRFLFYSRE